MIFKCNLIITNFDVKMAIFLQNLFFRKTMTNGIFNNINIDNDEGMVEQIKEHYRRHLRYRHNYRNNNRK